jgi:hypothetical protein
VILNFILIKNLILLICSLEKGRAEEIRSHEILSHVSWKPWQNLTGHFVKLKFSVLRERAGCMHTCAGILEQSMGTLGTEQDRVVVPTRQSPYLYKPFKEPRNRAGRYDNPICRTGPPGYIGWLRLQRLAESFLWNRFLGSLKVKIFLRLRRLAGLLKSLKIPPLYIKKT